MSCRLWCSSSGEIKAAKAAEEAGDAERAEQYRWECERLLGFTEYRFPRYRTMGCPKEEARRGNGAGGRF